MSIANLFNPNQENLYCGSITPTQTGYVTLDGIQTVTNKTLILPKISQIINGSGTLTLPSNTTTTLATTNDLIGFVTQTGSSVLTNKTINTNGPNSILINNVNVTALINQDVRTTANPTFTGLTVSQITNGGILTLPTGPATLAKTSDIPTNTSYVDLTTNQTIDGIKTFSSSTVKLVNSKLSIITWTQVTTTNFSIDVLTVPIPVNSAITIETNLTFYVTTGININKSGIRRRTHRASNVGGSVSASGQLENLTNNDAGLNAVAVQYVAVGNNVVVQLIGLIGDTILATGVTQVFYI